MTIMLIGAITVLVILSAAIHIGAEYGGARARVYVFKPLTVAFIIAIALGAQPSFYKYLILAGLLFSLLGDIFLMLPSDRFISGLISFLIAHLFYIAAFTIDGATARPSVLAAIVLLAYGGVMLRLLLPSLGKMKAPVVIYMLVILLMVWQASNRFVSVWETDTLLAFAGACLFAASDSLLALNRFRRPFRSAQLLILATYYSAQWLIALSAALRA
ncbi:MAG TPA: lysoplasmalogenase [Pyrinomonadaceae bacterium]|nr:lysoplasmalogenase [Pyrinomonadaceae bacterium]